MTALAGLAAEDAHLGSVGEGVGDAGAERGEVLGDGGGLEGAEGGVVGAVVDGEDSVGRQRGLRRLGLKGKRGGGQCGFFRGSGTEVGGWVARIKNWGHTQKQRKELEREGWSRGKRMVFLRVTRKSFCAAGSAVGGFHRGSENPGGCLVVACNGIEAGVTDQLSTADVIGRCRVWC